MNHKVQHIPVLVPGSGPEGPTALRIANMLVCGTVFVALAVLARKVTVTTQTTVVELTTITKKKIFGDVKSIEEDDVEEAKPMVEETK
jgi:hypothetical protein